ncbi:hypothetical protein pdam_00010049 [Pocillopora damicornis]|uniref:Uncharacterized protein n=1 Tax=Pocillopora damicornis TaxID=46731 RepID=A0A3M6T5B2_POCDA|nr:hypothetical protein pdam_00010049 [Pocillopora damicornis]
MGPHSGTCLARFKLGFNYYALNGVPTTRGLCLCLNRFPRNLMFLLMLSVISYISITSLLPGGSLTGLRTLPTPIFPDLTPGAGALDTFSVSWKGENNWLVPPAHYIIRVIQHLLVCGSVGILVAPYWPSNAF